jgi:hypothetical protein
MPSVSILELVNKGDHRGFSFSVSAEALAFVGQVGDFHVASILPRAVRGNHYHRRRREAILITYDTAWSFHWDEGEHSPPQHRQFAGGGGVLVLLEPGASHAVRNDGDGKLVLATILSEPYDPGETVARSVV